MNKHFQYKKDQPFKTMKVLHIANWYPNPWDNVEGNFIRDQIKEFAHEIPAEVIVVKVCPSTTFIPKVVQHSLDAGTRGYFLMVKNRPGKITEWLSALLLSYILLRERAWRFNVLHFHIAYPLLLHTWLWRWLIRKPILISEHWSAYHYNFHLPENSPALRTLRRPFKRGNAVLAVSAALLADIRKFAQTDAFPGFVIPNVVPLHGASEDTRTTPVFFTVNRWVPIKNPIPMLEGLNRATLAGCEFKLVIGGYGPMIPAMANFVETTALRERTSFLGKLTKAQISENLAQSDGYLFSSDYETFSISCAEALGAGLPLIGPHIAAISEYADETCWTQVKHRSAEGWLSAIQDFIADRERGRWNRAEIARYAAERFSESNLRQCYRKAMHELRLSEVR